MARSWMIRRKGDVVALFETFNPEIVKRLNTEKYEAVHAGDYLGQINRASRPTASEQSPSYRSAMRDAGRGHLLP